MKKNKMLVTSTVMEYTKPSKRTFSLNLCIGIFYCIGSIITPWIAVALGDWKFFLVAITIPALFVPFFYYLIYESAAWLITNNKIEEALINFQNIAKCNKRPLAKEIIDEFRVNFKNNSGDDYQSPSVIGLFKTPRLRRNTLILFFKS